MPTSTPSFESCIVTPILGLDAEFVTTPSKRDSAPLPKRKPGSFISSAPASPVDNNNNNNNDDLKMCQCCNNDKNNDDNNNAATGAGGVLTASGERYVEKLRHSLLHETFKAVGSNYDERDPVYGQVNLDVISCELQQQSWVFRCTVPVRTIKNISQQMSQPGRKRGNAKRSRDINDAEFFIRDNSLGLILEKYEKPVLAAIPRLKKYAFV